MNQTAIRSTRKQLDPADDGVEHVTFVTICIHCFKPMKFGLLILSGKSLKLLLLDSGFMAKIHQN